MVPEWILDVVRRQKASRITGKALAARCGYTSAYLSMILSGSRVSPQAQERILNALADMEKEKGLNVEPGANDSEEHDSEN